MNLINILGWVSNGFFVIGIYLVGKKNISGFYLNSIANGLYLYQAFLMKNSSLFWLSIILIILNIKAVFEWRKK